MGRIVMNEILDPIKIIDEYIGKTDIMHKETYPTKEASIIEKAAEVFSEMLVELWPDLLGFGGMAKKLENEFKKRLEEKL